MKPSSTDGQSMTKHGEPAMREDMSTPDVLTAEPSTSVASLALTGVTKAFPGVIALDDVTFECFPGEVHALVGENGSGKSTLIKVASGVLRPDVGQVRIGGVELSSADPLEARRLGLSVAYQDTSLVNELTVAENVELFTRSMPAGSGVTNVRQMLNDFGLPFGPNELVKSLGPGARQMLEVVRALSQSPQVLVLDEPTAALDMGTAEHLQQWIARARDSGLSIVYVSHRLAEVRRLANRLTVIRDGAVRGTYDRMDWEVDEIVELMVGASVELEFPRRAPVSDKARVRLAVDELLGAGVGPISVEVREGEIVGLAGAEGNGQRHLLRAIVGIGRSGGEVMVDGSRARISGPASALGAGIMFQSGDRATDSIFPTSSLLDNSTFQLGRASGPAGLALRHRLLSSFRSVVGRLGIVAASPYQPIGALSGGNQQKIVLSRPVLTQPKVLLVDEPTQGVDAKARLEIYGSLSAAAETGVAVVVNSSDSAELAGLCDRVYVMSDGAVIDEVVGDLKEPDIVRRFVNVTEKREVQDATGLIRTRRFNALAASPFLPVVILGLLIVALGAYTQSSNDVFLSPSNVTNIAITAMPLLCVALGQQFALISGGFDISIGAAMTLAVIGVSSELSELNAGSLVTTLGLLLAIGIAVGLANAFLILVIKINAIVATIGTLGILTGLAVYLRPEPKGQVAPDLTLTVMAGLGALPYCFLVAAVVTVALDVWLSRTGRGLTLRAVGLGPDPAARLGVRVNRYKAAGLILSAVGAVLGGLFLASQVGVGSNDVALSYALPTFAACFLGGATLSGGRGTFLGAVLGSVLLTMIGNATLLLGQTYATSQVIYGVILLVAVASYAIAGRRANS
jgi:ABC-type sugar transport system ATPase subunit/ribose/xylose/arabinose/galactoside ABC-type transport system permease subunit